MGRGGLPEGRARAGLMTSPQPNRWVPDAAGRLRPGRLAGAAPPPLSPLPVPARPSIKRALPGLSDSIPLLLFGLLSIGLSVYSLFAHANAFGSRVPLWSYLAGLGGIALAGGLASAAAREEITDLPRAGDRLGSDLLVVRRVDWIRLQARRVEPESPRMPKPPVPPLRHPQTTNRPTQSARPVRQPIASPAPEPLRPPRTPPDWWEDALRAAQEDGLLGGSRPLDPSEPADFREVLETLDSIEIEAREVAAGCSATDSRDDPQAAPDLDQPAAARLRAGPTHPNRPHPRADPTAALYELRAELDAITPEAVGILGATGPPSAPCAGCGTSLPSKREGGSDCRTCGRAMCRSCLDRGVAEERPGLCSRCAMLSESADG